MCIVTSMELGDAIVVSNQVLQKTLDGLTQITKKNFAVTDSEGGILATTMEDTRRYVDSARSFAGSDADSQTIFGCHYMKVFDEQRLEFIVIAQGDSEETYTAARILAFQIQELMVAYRERFDRDNFIKNLLLDNLLMVDIYNRATRLHVDIEARRIVMVVEVGDDKDGDDMERVRTLFSGRSKDFVTAVDEQNIIIVKELQPGDTYDDVQKIANTIVDLFHGVPDRNVRVAYGTIVNEIKDVSQSYKEASLALDVGRIFFKDRNVIAYSVLGIGRLIYQLPIPLCKMFIKEIFKDKTPNDFDEETITTINKFFENNLNVSETSRQLYIHRNTLVYRLDKLQKATGLDLRVFEDAITFKIALMVVEYMNYMEDHNF
jgi:carbohydrate diacid regulator